MSKGKFVEVAKVLPLQDDRRWYYIPGFNGYEISNDGYVRSMKHWKKYPTGLLIQSKKDVFELSNDNCERVRISRDEIMKLAMEHAEEYTKRSYPRPTYVCDYTSRNKRCFRPPKEKPRESDHYITPKFTVIHDEVKYDCPIYDLLGRNIYYGNKR